VFVLIDPTGPHEVGLLSALVLGLVEGLTEFLPVSSTGHLIVAGELLRVDAGALEIGIQLGAITAILVLYWRRLWDAAGRLGAWRRGSPNLLVLILVAAAPAGILGLLAGHWLKAHLFLPEVVATTMVLGGVVLLLLERYRRQSVGKAIDLPAMSYRIACIIGLCQCLALVPGTSRSAATIAGALLLGVSRPAAAEFSFLLGLPVLYGACAVDLHEHWSLIDGPLLVPFCVATLVAFLSALVVVRPFVAFLRLHTFVPFGWYRIVAGGLLAVGCLCGWLPSRA
jgi:undecaprenyl-diphosphatase